MKYSILLGLLIVFTTSLYGQNITFLVNGQNLLENEKVDYINLTFAEQSLGTAPNWQIDFGKKVKSFSKTEITLLDGTEVIFETGIGAVNFFTNNGWTLEFVLPTKNPTVTQYILKRAAS